MLNNVNKRYYGVNPLDTTGPGVWGRVVHKHCVLKVKCEYKHNYFMWNSTKIVRHKCTKCTKGQDWKYGNNYNTLWRTRQYYKTKR